MFMAPFTFNHCLDLGLVLYTGCEPLFAKTLVLEYVTIPKSFGFHM